MESQSLFWLFGFFVACFAVATSASIFRPGDWYEALAKPDWRPPNWIFGPVWTVLYGMIAISGWLVWREAGWTGGAVALSLYGLQLVLNGLWSAIFFGLRRLGLALFEMGLLWLAIAATILAFSEIHAIAAMLLVPYLLWVSFAFVLNAAIWRMNRSLPATGSLDESLGQ